MQHVVIQELPCKHAPIASSDEEFIMTLLSDSKQGHILKGHWGLSHGENRGRGGDLIWYELLSRTKRNEV